jgi:hypothetical protein
MYYQFKGEECVSTSSYPIAPMTGIVSVWCDAVYTDIENLRLINGNVVHVEPEIIEPEAGDENGTPIPS